MAIFLYLQLFATLAIFISTMRPSVVVFSVVRFKRLLDSINVTVVTEKVSSLI